MADFRVTIPADAKPGDTLTISAPERVATLPATSHTETPAVAEKKGLCQPIDVASIEKTLAEPTSQKVAENSDVLWINEVALKKIKENLEKGKQLGVVYKDAFEVPPEDPNNRIGYTWDPFRDPCQLADIHTPNIPFHNYRQIHISEIALTVGMSAPSMKEIPACPPLWTDCEHYWNIVVRTGFLLYEYGFGSKFSAAIRGGEIVGGGYIINLLMSNPQLITGVISAAMTFVPH